MQAIDVANALNTEFLHKKNSKISQNQSFSNLVLSATKESKDISVSDTPESEEDIAIFRSLYNESGTKFSVYKTKDFDSENPVYKVKMQNQAGNITERLIDISKIDCSNCDMVEFYTYSASLKEEGKGSFLDTVVKAAMSRAVEKREKLDLNQKCDWTSNIREMMDSAYKHGDIKGFLDRKKYYDLLLNKIY